MGVGNPFLFKDIESIDNVAAYMSTASGEIGVWNENMVQLLGFSKEDILGKTEKDLFLDAFEKSIFAGVRFSWRKHKDGSVRFVQETVVQISDIDSRFRYMKILEDYTNHLNLREKCELWFQHYEALGESVSVTNKNTFCFEFITEKCTQIYGYSKDMLEGQSFLKVLVPEMEERDVVLSVADQLVSVPQNMVRVPGVRKDGSQIFILVAATYLEEENGKYSFYLNHIMPAGPEMVRDTVTASSSPENRDP